MDEGYEAHTHDNNVEFIGTNIYFLWLSWAITDGQPIQSAYSSGDTLDVVAGRKASPAPAAAFTMGLSVTNLLGLDCPLSTAPRELNFAVFGTMSFWVPDGTKYDCPDFRIGQGSYGAVGITTHNNWWVGSSDCYQVPTSGTLHCCCGNDRCNASSTSLFHNYAITITSGGSDNQFVVTPYTSSEAELTI